MFKMNLLLRRR